MKIIIASDSFKGSLSSSQVADALEMGLKEINPSLDIVKVNVADGGEGTVDAVVDALGGVKVSAEVSDPLGRPISAEYGIAGDLAIVEVAAACGLTLLSKEERNPLLTTTRGVGELLLDAAARGCKRFLVGLGGSATNDGGSGMMSVPGIEKLREGYSFTVACDVDTPFVGPVGASRVFGPQKGASPEDVDVLEKRLVAQAARIKELTGVEVSDMKGAGAAGGLGGAFAAWFGAELVPGIDMVLDAVKFDQLLQGADMVITGEGKADFQTPKGKTAAGVLRRAKKAGVPAVLVAGKVDLCPELEAAGFLKILQSSRSSDPLEVSMRKDIAVSNLIHLCNQIL